jgi:hypothetical protein
MILYFARHIFLPWCRLRAPLLLRDAYLSWAGLASATIKAARIIAVTRVVIAFALAYFGIP